MLLYIQADVYRRALNECAKRQRCNAWSSWFPYMAARVVQKAASTSETPGPPPKPLRAAKSQQNGLPERRPSPAS